MFKSMQQGFTIIELMLVLAVAGVLLAIGVPSFQTTIKNHRLTAATNELIGAINFARSEAAKRGSTVHFGTGTGDAGWVVWIDGDDDDAPDGGTDTEIRQWPTAPAGVTVTSDNSFYTFGGSGVADKTGTFTLCDDRSDETGSEVELLVSGSVNRSPEDCS